MRNIAIIGIDICAYINSEINLTQHKDYTNLKRNNNWAFDTRLIILSIWYRERALSIIPAVE